MDKIVFYDLHNAIWRACVKFGNSILNVPDEIVFTFNFFRNLRPLIELFSPHKVFMVQEGHPKFRYDLYADYKANRIIKQASKKESSDTFYKTKDLIINLLQYFPVSLCRAEDYEADDVIGALCEDLKEEELVIISNDTDFIQLLQKDYKNIKVYSPIKKEYFKAPEYMYLVHKILVGDKSDNIKGIMKPKKALEAVLDPEKLKEFLSIEENRANFSINRKLIEFASVPLDEINFIEGQRNFSALREEFIKLKFDSITNDYSWDKYTKTFDCIKL